MAKIAGFMLLGMIGTMYAQSTVSGFFQGAAPAIKQAEGGGMTIQLPSVSLPNPVDMVPHFAVKACLLALASVSVLRAVGGFATAVRADTTNEVSDESRERYKQPLKWVALSSVSVWTFIESLMHL